MQMSELNSQKQNAKRVHVCELCSKPFTNFSNLKYHLAHHSNDSPWLCSECPRTYKTKADLLQHKRIHLQSHDYKSCGISFPTRCEYLSHHRTHMPQIKEPVKNVPKKCSICDKMFTNLTSHIQSVHENVRKHVCSVCSKAFSKKSGLDRHILTVHDKMKNFPCEKCGRSFGEKTLLTRHRKVHDKAVDVKIENGEDEEIIVNNKKRMRCGMCRKILNSRSALTRHKLFVHEKKQNILCSFCPKLFGERSDLQRHIRRMHALENSSTEASKINPSSSINIDLARQSKIKIVYDIADTYNKKESYICELCDSRLTTKWGFDAHQEFCKLKKQQELNEQDDTEKEDNQSDGICEQIEDEDDLINGKRAEIEYNKNVKIEGELEEVFLVTDEYIEADEMKIEPVCLDENVSNNSSMEIDKICTVESTSRSSCTKLKVEVKEELDFEDDASSEGLPDLGNTENDFNDVCSSDSSDDEHKPDLKVDLSVVKSEYSVKKEFNCRVVLKRLKLARPNNDNEQIPAARSDEESRTCHKCKPKKIFQNLRSFQRHIKTVHLEQRFECDICQKSFTVKRSLERHVKGTHQGIYKFKCEESGCGKSFYDISGLRNHQNCNHNTCDKADRTCKICFKVFQYKKYLKLHISSVHEAPQFSCPICHQTFSFAKSMARHIQTVHENRKDLACTNDGCDIVFQSSYELNEHLKVIHGASIENAADDWKNIESNRTCDVCQEIFATRRALNLHRKKIHNTGPLSQQNVEKATCDICNKVLATANNLRTHKQFVHEGVRFSKNLECRLCKEMCTSSYMKRKHWKQVHRYGRTIFRKCQLCDRDFQLFAEYKDHIKGHVGAYICITCGAYFADESTLSVHVESHKTVEGEIRPYQCDICLKREVNKHRLEVHMRKHYPPQHYVCEICGKAFKYIAPFLFHKQGHTKQFDFPCQYCGKQFRTKQTKTQHERLHTGERPFKCTQCPKTFAVKTVFSRHMMKSHDLTSIQHQHTLQKHSQTIQIKYEGENVGIAAIKVE